LPVAVTAATSCFRREAGAAGKDTRGLVRVHQFQKVELVQLCAPEDSSRIHEEMLGHADGILKALQLPYRVLLLSTGDMGATAMKTYDLEVWMPGLNRWLEISSISNCGEYQARRGMIRYKAEKGNRYVHTLNGSGLAAGRTMIAIIENYQNADGSFTVPEALRPYLGTDRIG
ncbi:MAG: serine--tRNA ligase, partial [Leptospiraceae bacterium]|nr:serine--tRNA ligase [Leptospiraceae bacterium]